MKMQFKHLGNGAIPLLISLVALETAIAGDPSPCYFAARPGALAETKTRLAKGDESLQPALGSLVAGANQARKTEPLAVVRKSRTPPSGDKHDYMSVAPYYWPDPAKPNGMPYLRRDGETNPGSHDDSYDFIRLERMAGTVDTLALAYYFTGDETYATHAAKFLRTWFIDPATRMTPHMEFAQAIPGVNTGRGIGILEGQNLSKAADAAALLAGSPAWTAEDGKALNQWLETYLNWVLTSRNGRDEAAARNNHGTWYDVQTTEIALILGKIDLAKRICGDAGKNRLTAQIALDGSQPEELARTATYTYSCYNLSAWFKLAILSEHAGVDLWHRQLPDGRNALAAALDFMRPYAADASKKWPYQEIRKYDRTGFAPQLRLGASVYQDPEYERILDSLPDMRKKTFQLVHPVSGK